MVIECPSCKTRFAIDVQQLSGIDNPRFHCSRCNHVFDMPSEALEGEKKPPPSSSKVKSNSVQSVSLADVPSELIEEPEPEQLELLPKQSATTAGSIKSAAANAQAPSSSYGADEDKLGVKADWPGADQAQPIEVDMSYLRHRFSDSEKTRTAIIKPTHYEFPSFQEQLTEESPEENEEESSKLRDSFPPDEDSEPELPSAYRNQEGAELAASKEVLEEDHYQDTSEDSEEKDASFEDLSTDENNTPGEEGEVESLAAAEELTTKFPLLHTDPQSQPGLSGPSMYAKADEALNHQSSAQQGWQRRKLAYRETLVQAVEQKQEHSQTPLPELSNAEPESQLASPDSLPPSISTASEASYTREMPGILGLILISALPVVFLIFFFVWGLYLEQSPPFVGRLFGFETNGLPKLPPSGLVLVDVRCQPVTLDDGKKVLEVSGQLLNATLKSYQNIKIEAQTYDSQNMPLNKVLVDLNNGLANASLAALSQEAIQTLEETSGSADSRILPNTRVPVRVVFTSLTNKETWYSARVYSVEPAE